MINEPISYRINLLRFPMILAVVFLHANAFFVYGLYNDPGTLTGVVRSLFSGVFGNCGVPFFFLIAGYLFFKDFELSYICYRKIMLRRLRTLIIPFLIWNGGNTALKMLAERIPAMAQYTGWGGTGSTQVSGAVGVVGFVCDFFNSPVAAHFWFVRDLFLLCLISPVFWIMAKRFPVGGFLLLIPLWLLRINYPIILLSHIWETTVFFYFAAFLAVGKRDLTRWDRYLPVFAVAYVVFAILYFIIIMFSFLPTGSPYVRLIYSLDISTGILFFWTLTSRIGKRSRGPLLWASSLSFFVFAAHNPLLDVLQKMIFKLVYVSGPLGFMFFYFGSVFIVLSLCLMLGQVIRRYIPAFFKIITGRAATQLY